MKKETMTQQERWLAVVERKTPDRIATDYWATEEATKKLLEYLDCDFDAMIERLHIDLPLSVGGKYTGADPPEGFDRWGIEHRIVRNETGAYWEAVNAPLAEFKTVEEIEANYKWQNVDEWDYSHLQKQLAGQEHRVVKGGGHEPFLRYKLLRGDEQAYMDLALNPEIAHYCLDKISDFFYQHSLRLFEAIPGRIDFSYVSEDLGAQSSLLCSPEHIREFIFPNMKHMAELVRQNDSWVFHHDDGAIREVIPELIDLVGIQILNPIQWRLPGMDREGLKKDFGDKLIFHGAMDNQYTMPFGTVDDVRQEAEENIRILGGGGGYIFGPCHNLQANTPPENIVAMYDTAYEIGWS